MNIVRKESPNQNDRKDGMTPFMLILHYTGTQTAAEADVIYMAPARVSPHYMIDRDGSVTAYVPEEKRAWHAGASSWDGHKDINSASIGIEIVNGGHEFGLEDFPPTQIDTLVALIHEIRSRWKILDHYILGHSDIAPGRKIDPGEKFPWAALNEKGIGLWPNSDSGAVTDLKSAFLEFGYDYTGDLDILKTEFCRHYLPKSIGTAADDEIGRALASLLKQKN